MKAVCTKNSDHKEFITTAHVMQEWKVDSEGNFLEVTDPSLEVTHKPDKDNCWRCAICGADALAK